MLYNEHYNSIRGIRQHEKCLYENYGHVINATAILPLRRNIWIVGNILLLLVALRQIILTETVQETVTKIKMIDTTTTINSNSNLKIKTTTILMKATIYPGK